MKVDFYLRFQTQFGQKLAISGNLTVLGNHEPEKALLLEFLNDEFWHTSIEIDPEGLDLLQYRYIFTDRNGDVKKEAEKNRIVEIKKNTGDVVVIDTWNDEGFVENAFFTTPFTEVFLKNRHKSKNKKNESGQHQFRVKSPLLDENEAICLIGNSEKLNNWSTVNPQLLYKKDDWWTLTLDLPASDFAISYKYGIYNTKKEEFIRFEEGDNRVLHNDGSIEKRTIVHDGFVRIPNPNWKGTGVAIPVFSLRTQNSFGIGEFADIKLLVDWAQQTGIKLIQLLPVNDTTATFTWMDSYPYAAISAFALHPIYINLQKVAGKKQDRIIKALSKKQKQLNQLKEIDYEQVIHFKMNVLHELFDLDEMSFLKEEEFKLFFEDNQNWLVPYAAFCFLRDKYGTADYSKCKNHAVYNEEEIERL